MANDSGRTKFMLIMSHYERSPVAAQAVTISQRRFGSLARSKVDHKMRSLNGEKCANIQTKMTIKEHTFRLG